MTPDEERIRREARMELIVEMQRHAGDVLGYRRWRNRRTGKAYPALDSASLEGALVYLIETLAIPEQSTGGGVGAPNALTPPPVFTDRNVGLVAGQSRSRWAD